MNLIYRLLCYLQGQRTTPKHLSFKIKCLAYKILILKDSWVLSYLVLHVLECVTYAYMHFARCYKYFCSFVLSRFTVKNLIKDGKNWNSPHFIHPSLYGLSVCMRICYLRFNIQGGSDMIWEPQFLRVYPSLLQYKLSDIENWVNKLIFILFSNYLLK